MSEAKVTPTPPETNEARETVRKYLIPTLEASLDHTPESACGILLPRFLVEIAIEELQRRPDLVKALKKIAALRDAEDANEPFDGALDIADAALAALSQSKGGA